MIYIFILILSLIYIVFEFHFNTTLLLTASLPRLQMETLEHVEHYGRLISSAGLALTMAGIILPSRVRWSAWAGSIPWLLISALALWLTLIWSGMSSLHDAGAPHFMPAVIVGLGLLLGLATLTSGSIADRIEGSNRKPGHHPDGARSDGGRFDGDMGPAARIMAPGPVRLLSTLRRPAIFLATLMVAMPGMYYGQKAAIETWVIEPSDGQDRLLATRIQFLKTGLAEGRVDLGGVHLPSLGGADTPEAMTFLSLVSAISMNARQFVDTTLDDAMKSGIAAEIMRNRMLVDVSSRYEEYRNGADRFEKEFFQAYESGVVKYQDKRKKAFDDRESEWLKLQDEISKNYSEYNSAEKKYIKSIEDYYENNRRNIHAHYRALKNCRTEACIARRQSGFAKEWSRSNTIPAPDQMSFCRTMTREEHIATRAERILLGDAAPLAEIFSGLVGGAMLSCPTDDKEENFVKTRLLEVNMPRFVNETGGIEFGVRNEDFPDHPVVARKIRDRLAKEGLNLPSAWSPRDAGSFDRAYRQKVEKDSAAQWRSSIVRDLGFYLEPGLSREDLYRNPDVQKLIRKEVGEDYVPGWRWNWSEKEFASKAVLPAVERRIDQEIAALRRYSIHYANGGRDEMDGKNALRAAVVPVISLGISLFFAFYSLFKIVSELMAGGIAAIVARSGGRLSRIVAAGPGKMALKWSLLLVMASSLILLPKHLVANNFADSDAYRNLSGMARESAPALTAMADWSIRMQPLVAAYGVALVEKWDPVGILDIRGGAQADGGVAPAPTGDSVGGSVGGSARRDISSPVPVAPGGRASGSEASGPDIVRQVQARVGVAADGLYGPMTAAAIRRWRVENGLPADGGIDTDLLRKMGIGE